MSFSTNEKVVVESVLKLQTKQGLKSISWADLLITVYQVLAVADRQKASELSHNCLIRLLQLKQPIISQGQLEQTIFATLQAYQPASAIRYAARQPSTQKLLDPQLLDTQQGISNKQVKN